MQNRRVPECILVNGPPVDPLVVPPGRGDGSAAVQYAIEQSALAASGAVEAAADGERPERSEALGAYVEVP